MRRLALLFVVPLMLLAACGQQKSLKGDQVRAYLLENPEVIEEALGKLQEKRQAQADVELRKQLTANQAQLEQDPRDFVAGNPQGRITLVEFFDYRCPYCKVAGPQLEKMLAENKDVRLVMKEYPILSPASEAAARAALAAKAQGRYWPVHQALMAEQNLDQANIDRILRESGVDMAEARAVAAAPATTEQINDVHGLARATNVSGTPAFLVGGRMIPGWAPDQVRKAIEAARKG